MIEKYESRRIRVQIRHVLMDVWDPIGVKDFGPHAQDEYDGYLGEILELLVNHSTDAQIAAHLSMIITERMGLTATSEDMLPTVEALRKIQLPPT